LAAFEPQRGIRLAAPCVYELGGGDRGVRGERTRFERVGRKRPRVRVVRALKWETRREARFSPVSFAPGGPELSGVRFARLRTHEPAREEDVRVGGHGAERLRDESDLTSERRKASRRIGRCAGKATKHECSSWNGFGVQKSVGRIAGREVRGSYQAPLGNARPRSKES